jgi:hypothetical protein
METPMAQPSRPAPLALDPGAMPAYQNKSCSPGLVSVHISTAKLHREQEHVIAFRRLGFGTVDVIAAGLEPQWCLPYRNPKCE